MKNSKLYCCYSVPLRNYLSNNGIRYEICAKNPNSNILMWIYIRTDIVNYPLSEANGLQALPFKYYIT